jgi:glycosyltransferase involved in cell wall biosynthesis
MTLHPDVPDVVPYLANAAVAVNPAVTGSGVNIKLVEYLQGGVPVVSTKLATRGLPLRPGHDLEVFDDPTDFAGAVTRLLTDPLRAADLAESGRARIIDLLDPERNLQRLAAAFGCPTTDATPA